MKLNLASKVALCAFTVATLVFLYLPLVVVARLSFNPTKSVGWSGWSGFTLDWWRQVWEVEGPKQALLNSCKVAAVAMVLAMVLGTMAAMAMARFQFFGKSAVSFILVLPIALPGIVTGIALQNTFARTINLGLFSFRVGFGFHSLVIAHATFCVVVAYNNVLARLRRSSPNLLEASADLGAHGSQTFRYVTFPLMRSALLAGGILAFALSFDEIVVTTFTAGSGFKTLPIWILEQLSNRQNPLLPYVMATLVMVVSIPLAWLAQRLSDGGGDG
ncbi:MAG: ABC transporter permease [Actinomycetota bacterium]|nr:ABC transporter permease [Actinomycetota bacterium]